MRLKLFLAVSLLAGKAAACTYCPYTPDDTYLYQIREDVSQYYFTQDYFLKRFDFCDENLCLWREQTGTKMSDDRLRMLIYGNNTDVDKAGFSNCQEANDCLETIKSVQRIRKAMADPWYFPSGRNGGEYATSLEELVDECRQRAEGLFRERYVLQGLRCLNTLRRWDESVEFWEQQRDSLPDNFIRSMAEREAAAAYLRTGNDSIAASIYSRIGDIASLRMCKINPDDEMEFIYEHCPDSPYFPEEIQNILIRLDSKHKSSQQTNSDWYPQDSLLAQRFLKLCQRVIRERKVKNPAMWFYASAATLDALSRPKEALPLICEGARLAGDTFLRKSFRILRMHIDAQISALNYNYEQRLFHDLQWIVREIGANMNKAERRFLCNQTNYQWNGNTYFWNDAMRRILLCDVCPRLVAAGSTSRALQLANFADYYLYKKLGNKTVHLSEWREHEWDEFSYSSNLFELTDSLSASQLAAYVRCHTEGDGPFDRFLASGSYLDATYWCDIVGTHYLRENKYREAVTWLSRLPKNYERQTNIYREAKDYLMRNPFDLSFNDPNHRRSRLESTADYKLNFAKSMVRYENDMKKGKTADIRGEAKAYYAAGLRNQMDYCWSLTKYSYSCYEYIKYDEDWEPSETDEYGKTKALCSKLMQEGIDEVDNPDIKARLRHAMHRNRDVMQNYPTTETARQIRLQCDTWRDYVNGESLNKTRHISSGG